MAHPTMSSYDWKDRLRPLLVGPMLVWLFWRPAYWPFASFGDAADAFSLDIANRILWVSLLFGMSVAVDRLVLFATSQLRRNTREKLSPPHVYWSALVATLAIKTIIDFAFASRPLPAGSESWFALERYCDLVACVLLPIIGWFVQRMGRPSNWPLLRAFILQPPTTRQPLD